MSMRASRPEVVSRSVSERAKVGLSHENKRFLRPEKLRGGGRQRRSGICIARLWRIGFQVEWPRKIKNTIMTSAPQIAEKMREISSWLALIIW